MTNQGTDAHLVAYQKGPLTEGVSYLMKGKVNEIPRTSTGGHVFFPLDTGEQTIPCMAFEPTKKFRDIIRSLRPGDEILAAGSYLKNTLNLEKIYVFSADPFVTIRPPLCPVCQKRMTSAGAKKGYKCRRCGNRERESEQITEARTISPDGMKSPREPGVISPDHLPGAGRSGSLVPPVITKIRTPVRLKGLTNSVVCTSGTWVLSAYDTVWNVMCRYDRSI
jgi:tRNA(Ile2) C34 agmatinyltransferase TiaS